MMQRLPQFSAEGGITLRDLALESAIPSKMKLPFSALNPYSPVVYA
jgi:hypothetical protein